jgi:hypothetical protein
MGLSPNYIYHISSEVVLSISVQNSTPQDNLNTVGTSTSQNRVPPYAIPASQHLNDPQEAGSTSMSSLQQMNCSHKAVSNSKVNLAKNVEVPKIPVALPKLLACNLQFLCPNEKPYEALMRLYIEGDKLHAIAPLKEWKQKEKNIDAKMKNNFSHYKHFVQEIFAIGGVEEFERQFPHLVDELYTFIWQELGKLRK